MLRSTLSELTRLRRRAFVLGWLGLTALFSAVITVFVFTSAEEGTAGPAAGPGGEFPTAAELAQSDGLIATLGSGATLLGVIALSFWAIATATDYSTGLVRLLVQAQPHRGRLLAGKVLALTGWTALATTIGLVVVSVASLLMARASGVSTTAWSADVVGTLGGAWLNTFLALLVWGVIGLVIAVVARSSAIAISVGIGYVLVVEGLLGLAAEGIADWLPGATLTALAQGGTATVAYGTAIALGLLYAALGLVAATVTFSRRDILD